MSGIATWPFTVKTSIPMVPSMDKISTSHSTMGSGEAIKKYPVTIIDKEK